MTKPDALLPYRACVGIMLLNSRSQVWIGRRVKKPHDNALDRVWQMPQGGIDKGESPVEAAVRELVEETGVSSVDVLKESDDWLFYDLPPDLVGKALKGKYRGQKQKWFAMRFMGEESEIDIGEKPGHSAEFDQWRWAEQSELAGIVVPFKRRVYEEVVQIFSDL